MKYELYKYTDPGKNNIPWLMVKVNNFYWVGDLDEVKDDKIPWYAWESRQLKHKFLKCITKYDDVLIDGYTINEWKEYLNKYAWLFISPISHRHNGFGDLSVDIPRINYKI